MCEGFLRNFGKLLPLEESFTDWLVVNLRPLRKQKLSFATFHSHYLEEKKFSEEDERKKILYVVTIYELRTKLRLQKRSFRVYDLSTSYLSNKGFSRISKKI